MDTAAQLRPSRASALGSASTFGAALPFLALLVLGIAFPLFGGGYWGVIADPRLRLLGAGVRPQSGRRLRRPDRDRLGGAAHARRLHHQRARGRQRHAGAAALSGAGDCGRGRRRLRPDHRSAGAAAAHLLFRHHDAWLRHHRHAGGARLAERDRRRRRRSRADLPAAVRLAVGLLLFLLRPGGDLHLDDDECRGKPLRPRADRDPRRGGRGRSKRHLKARFAGDGVPVQRRRRCGRRRAVCLIAILHHAGRLHARPVDLVLHRHPDRRARVHSRAAPRHDSFDRAAGIRRAIGRVVHIPLCGAAARHRARDAGRNCRDCWISRTAARSRAAARSSRGRICLAAARRAARCRRADAGAGGAELRRGESDRRPRPRNPARSSARADRPQRQRQDHDAERHLRLLCATARRGQAERQRRCRCSRATGARICGLRERSRRRASSAPRRCWRTS